MEKTGGIVVVNPTAGNGLIRGIIPALKRQLDAQPGWQLIIATEVQLDDVVEDALRLQTTRIVVVGGDGTNHHLFTALYRVGGEAVFRNTEFVFTNGGTMNFLARSLNTNDTPLEHLARVLQGQTEARSMALLRFDGVAGHGHPLLGTFAGLATAAAVLGKYHRTAGGRLRIIEWIARGAIAAFAPAFSPATAALLVPASCEVEIDGRPAIANPISLVVSAIAEFRLRFPFIPPVKPFRRPFSGDQFGVIASNRTPRELVSGVGKLWRGRWDEADKRVVNTLARSVTISGSPGVVNIDGEEYYGGSEVRVSLGPRIRVLV